MKASAIILCACGACVAACGASTPPPSAPAHEVSPAAKSSDPNRPLSEDECGSLARWLAEACQTRPNERSARVEGWCSDMLRGVEDGSWVKRDCLKHVTYMDAECMRSASNVHTIMDCNRSVDRSE